MKNIELAEDHQDKLQKMCEKLFPEYLFWSICNHQFIMLYIMKDDKKSDIYIHWFEFCMTHLAKKIFEKTNIQTNYISEEIKKIIWNYLSNINHPVDYLYEEFKKLKLCKNI